MTSWARKVETNEGCVEECPVSFGEKAKIDYSIRARLLYKP